MQKGNNQSIKEKPYVPERLPDSLSIKFSALFDEDIKTVDDLMIKIKTLMLTAEGNGRQKKVLQEYIDITLNGG